MSDDTCCPNCGKSGYDGKECRACAYKPANRKELPEAQLVYCEGCACFYLTKEDGMGCRTHNASQQKPAKL